MRRRTAIKFRRSFTGFFALLLIAIFYGCQQEQPRLVPISDAQPLMTYQNSSPRFRLRAFMYAPGNLLFRVENLLPDFHVTQLPEITSATGRILEARLLGEDTIEFNLILPGTGYTESSSDVTIPWVLEEKGPEAFLRSEGIILVDVGTSRIAKYFVKSVSYQSGSELTQPGGEAS